MKKPMAWMKNKFWFNSKENIAELSENASVFINCHATKGN